MGSIVGTTRYGKRLSRPVIAAVGCLAVLTACSSSGAPNAQGTTPPAVHPSASTALPSPSTVPAPSASSPGNQLPTTAAPPPGQPPPVTSCTTDQLRLTVGPVQGAAGTELVSLVLTNAGAACTVQGYPGVSLLDGQRNQVGPAAQRYSEPYSPVFLPSGASASALFTVTPPQCNGGLPPESAFVRIFPPGQLKDIISPAKIPICMPVIGALHPGSRPPQRG